MAVVLTYQNNLTALVYILALIKNVRYLIYKNCTRTKYPYTHVTSRRKFSGVFIHTSSRYQDEIAS